MADTDTDTDIESWTPTELTDHPRHATPDADGLVVRELTRRMAEQLPDCAPGSRRRARW